jgi:pimeloyl-ACP methyl ester carboxylesterase
MTPMPLGMAICCVSASASAVMRPFVRAEGRRYRSGSLEEAAAAVAAYNPHRPPPSDLRGLAKNLRERDGRWYWHWDPAFMNNKGLSEVADTDRLRRAAQSLAPPVLLVRGRMSDVVSEEGVRSFLADCPHARFVDVSGAGHMVAGDRNDAFTHAVVDFLDSLDRGPVTP